MDKSLLFAILIGIVLVVFFAFTAFYKPQDKIGK